MDQPAGVLVAPVNGTVGETTVHSLPNELLVSIFEVGNQAPTYPQAYRAPRSIRPRPKYAAGIASLVCRRWRDVIKRSPILWMTSLIFNGYSTEESIRAQAKWLETPLSGDLDIVIDSDLLDSLLTLVLDSLLPHCRRWRALLVTQGPIGLARVSREINRVDYKFPRLRVFSCSRINHLVQPADVQLINGSPLLDIELDNFEPRVDSVELSGMAVGFAKGCPLLSNLTYLSLTLTQRCPRLSCRQLIGALRACPDLGTFRLVAPSLRDDLKEEDARELVILRALANLEFCIYGGNRSSATLLDTLRFPKLVRLRFAHLGLLNNTNQQPLVHLQELTLTSSFEHLKVFFKTYCSLKGLHSIIIDLTSFDIASPVEPRICLPAAVVFSLTSDALTYPLHPLLLHFDAPKVQRLAIVHPSQAPAVEFDNAGWTEPPITLPKMDHLAIQNLKHSTVHYCFSRMSFNALRKLTIADCPSEGLTWTTLRENYSNFLLPVEELELLISDGRDDVSALYHCMPNVRKLFLMLEVDRPDWVARLGGPDEGRPGKYEGEPLPKLDHLTLSCTAVETARDWTTIVKEVISNRKGRGIGLRELFYDIRISPEDSQWLSTHTAFSHVQCTFK